METMVDKDKYPNTEADPAEADEVEILEVVGMDEDSPAAGAEPADGGPNGPSSPREFLLECVHLEVRLRVIQFFKESYESVNIKQFTLGIVDLESSVTD